MPKIFGGTPFPLDYTVRPRQTGINLEEFKRLLMQSHFCSALRTRRMLTNCEIVLFSFLTYFAFCHGLVAFVCATLCSNNGCTMYRSQRCMTSRAACIAAALFTASFVTLRTYVCQFALYAFGPRALPTTILGVNGVCHTTEISDSQYGVLRCWVAETMKRQT